MLARCHHVCRVPAISFSCCICAGSSIAAPSCTPAIQLCFTAVPTYDGSIIQAGGSGQSLDVGVVSGLDKIRVRTNGLLPPCSHISTYAALNACVWQTSRQKCSLLMWSTTIVAKPCHPSIHPCMSRILDPTCHWCINLFVVNQVYRDGDTSMPDATTMNYKRCVTRDQCLSNLSNCTAWQRCTGQRA